MLDLIFFKMAADLQPRASLPNRRCKGKFSKGRGKDKDEEERQKRVKEAEKEDESLEAEAADGGLDDDAMEED